MTPNMLLVFAILAITLTLFISDRFRLDVVALLSLLALTLTGILSASEALAGFSDALVIMIAGLFVVSGGLFKTGVARRLGQWLGRAAGESEFRLIAFVMLVTAFLSGFMSSTGTVAVMLPVVVTLAWGAKLSPSKLLIPLAFGSLLGGMLTLIGTPPNIAVSRQLETSGLTPFNFFSFTPVGLGMLIVGMLFMLFIGRHMLPSRAPTIPGMAEDDKGDTVSFHELAEAYELPERLFHLRVPAGAKLVGQSLAEAELRQRYGVTVLAMRSGGTDSKHPKQEAHSRSLAPHTRFQAGDLLDVEGEQQQVEALTQDETLELLASSNSAFSLPANLGLVEVLLTPRSSLLDRSLRQCRFRDHYRATVVAIKRLNSLVKGDIGDEPLRFGDSLLVKAPWAHIELLQSNTRDFVVVAKPAEEAAAGSAERRAPLAIAIMVGMLLLMTFDLVPGAIAVLMAAVAMVMGRCISMEDAYHTINWESVVLIAAILPMSTALEKTGAVTYIVERLSELRAVGPFVMMILLFVLTSLLSQIISNTATAVLISPIAFQTAMSLEVSPYTLLMTVAIAASTAFATPIASPVNTIVLGPGNYRFSDFLKVGIFMQLLILLATVIVVPFLFPF